MILLVHSLQLFYVIVIIYLPHHETIPSPSDEPSTTMPPTTCMAGSSAPPAFRATAPAPPSSKLLFERGRLTAGRYVCLKEVDISILVICYASDDIEYNKRIPELSNEPLHITQDANSIEK